MSDNDLELDSKRFDIYLHLNDDVNEEMNDINDVDEEMKAIKDVSVEEYSYEQLMFDAHDLALSQFPKCSKESVFVSHERMVRGRRCKSPLTCDYGLKKLFSLNQTTYVFFVKCYDGVPGLRLLGKAKKRSKELSHAENDDSSDSDEDLIKQASTSCVWNVPLSPIAEVDEERMMVSENQIDELGDRTDNASATRVNDLSSMLVNGRLASISEAAGERRTTRSMVENVPSASPSVSEERRITRSMVENATVTSTAEVEEDRMMLSSNQLNQMGDLTNHVSVTQDNVTEGEPKKYVYARKRRKASTSSVKHAPLPSIAEVDEEMMTVSENQMNDLGDRTDYASATHVNDLTSMVENAPLASVSEAAGERRITRSTVENVPSDSEVVEERGITRSVVENVTIKEDRTMVSSNQLNQMGDLTNHVSVTHAYVTEEEPKKYVYVRKRRKVSSSEPPMLHRQDMVARVEVL